jgi:flagellar M-ring protein FliF
MDSMTGPGRMRRNQLLMFGGSFAGVVGLLALGYFLFLRTDYVVLVQGMRPADAAAVVGELDKRGTAYRLSDQGTTVLVAQGEADAARVALAGSDVAARGQTGFELFNKSDMGLTNFAQKINYQRALQGELVRTITLMEGVESARVHLALPERTLFRGERAEPKAAVTVAMKPGQTADPARVAGIQRLVAAAVPDLPEARVVVLDSTGRIISTAVAETVADRPADMEERAAVENYYRARARGAVERSLPGIRFVVRVLALPLGSARAPAPGGGQGDAAAPIDSGWTPSGEGATRNFRLRLLFVTEAALGADDQAQIRAAIAQAAGLDTTLGDTLSFETGPVDPVPAPASPAQAEQREAAAVLPAADARVPTGEWPGGWAWGLAALIAAAFLAWLLRRRERARLGDADHEAFAARLRRQLNLESSDAAA